MRVRLLVSVSYGPFHLNNSHGTLIVLTTLTYTSKMLTGMLNPALLSDQPCCHIFIRL